MIAVAAATLALASPVYLECQMNQEWVETTPEDAPWNWKITANESSGWVEYEHKQGAKRVPAMFTADKVKFDGNEIDRKTLVFKREFLDKTTIGRCRVAKIEDRAF